MSCSIEIEHLFAAVLGIANQPAALHVDHKVKHFERNLADQRGLPSGTSMTSTVQSRPWTVNRTASYMETWIGPDTLRVPGSSLCQAELLNCLRRQGESRGTGIHQRI